MTPISCKQTKQPGVCHERVYCVVIVRANRASSKATTLSYGIIQVTSINRGRAKLYKTLLYPRLSQAPHEPNRKIPVCSCHLLPRDSWIWQFYSCGLHVTGNLTSRLEVPPRLVADRPCPNDLFLTHSVTFSKSGLSPLELAESRPLEGDCIRY